MYFLKTLALVGAVAPFLVTANENANIDELIKTRLRNPVLEKLASHKASAQPVVARDASPSQSRYLNSKSEKFAVNGKKIPLVNFDVGESYAGVLPISSDPNETRKLYFWFFPSEEPQAKDEVAVWLNGGPGCSSLSGLLTENGPFLWQAGTRAPVKNPYAFNKLTNYVWIDQPVGTGFSPGQPNITNQIELAEQFKGFWKNFVDTFELHNNKVYFTGESYAGKYVPYVTNAFLEANDTKYFNAKGIAINDPTIGNSYLQFALPVVPFVDYWSNALGIDEPTIEKLRQENEACGYTNYTNTYFTFPPPKQPWPQPPSARCQAISDANNAIYNANPCFNVYHITDQCPFVYGHLGIVNDGDYEPPGGTVYFQRKDVKKAINAPDDVTWLQCGGPVFVGGDHTRGPALDGTLTNIIDKTKNAFIGSGALDFLLTTNGTLFVLQNTTWGGTHGFREFPSHPFFVPDHAETEPGRLGPSGNVGVWREERGLTFYDIQLAGHEAPGYSASSGYRVIQVMLGRVKDFGSRAPLF